jgi:CubicO group peptidase (beta-lactamase class C family)
MSIESICRKWVGDRGPGVAVAVIQDGEVTFKQGFGLADLDEETEITPATVFDLASVSKHITATAVMLLAEREELSYDDPLSKFFPDFPSYAEDITVRHLLQHTSGLKDYMELWDEALEDEDSEWTEEDYPTSEDILNMLMEVEELDFEPGEKFEYSNSGYMVLAQIVGQVAGVPFPQFVRDELFRPAGMRKALVMDESDPEIANRAGSYEANDDDEYENIDDHNLSRIYGDGAVNCTLDELIAWNKALDEHKIVSEETQQEAWTSGTTNDGEEHGYGYGWFVSETDDGDPYINHEGSWVGFRTAVYKLPAQGLTVMALANFADAEPGELVEKIIEAVS